MEEELVFPMGKFKAKIPCGLVYTKNHMWINKGEVSIIGITHYRQRFLMDIEDISFSLDAGDKLKMNGQIAKAEGIKAVMEIISEFSGEVAEVNEELDLEPSLINSSTYDEGWLLKIRGLCGDFLSPEEYLEMIHSEWEEIVEEIVLERGDGKVLPPI